MMYHKEIWWLLLIDYYRLLPGVNNIPITSYARRDL